MTSIGNVFKVRKEVAKCLICGRKFSRKFDMKKHVREIHDKVANHIGVSRCLICDQAFLTEGEMEAHIKLNHDLSEFILFHSVWERASSIYGLRVDFKGNVNALYELIKRKVMKFIKGILSLQQSVKISIMLLIDAKAIAQVGSGDSAGSVQEKNRLIVLRAPQFFASSGNMRAVRGSLHHSFNILDARVDDFLLEGSGWTMDNIRYVELEINELGRQTLNDLPQIGMGYNGLSRVHIGVVGEKYDQSDHPDQLDILPNLAAWLSMPRIVLDMERSGDDADDVDDDAESVDGEVPQKSLPPDPPTDMSRSDFFIGASGTRATRTRTSSRMKHIIDVENTDHKCFLYAVAGYWLTKRPKITSEALKKSHTYKKFINDQFNISGIEFPIKCANIDQFVNQNKHLDLTINMLSLDIKQRIFPLDSVGHGKNIVNILFYEFKSGVYHAVYITDIDKFLRKKYNSVNGSYDKSRSCAKCLTKFFSDEKLAIHVTRCRQEDSFEPKVVLPSDGNKILKFKNGPRKVKFPYCLYIDFETLQAPRPDLNCPKCHLPTNNCVCESSTVYEADLEPKCFSLILVNWKGEIIFVKNYVGDDAANVAISTIMALQKDLKNRLVGKESMVITDEEQLEFDCATVCYLCNEIFDSPLDHKTRDHDHHTSFYLGAAHKICNVNRQTGARGGKIPVFAHNMRGFDSAFLIKAMDAKVVGDHISCIGGNVI